MAEWIAQALSAVRRGQPLAMATVVGAQGSTPREIGARVLVWEGGFSGTIGGGALEHLALDQARKLLAQEARRHALQDYPLGPLLGQCCGGRVRLLVERLDAASLGWLTQADQACRDGAAFRLCVTIEGGALVRSVAAPGGEDVADNSPRTPIPDVRALSEAIQPSRPRLIVIGAGHVGHAVARAFAPLPFHLDWLASREDLPAEAGEARPTILAEAELEARVAAAPTGAMVAIFTHSHDLDYRLTRAGLRNGGLAYLGLIGSATKRARFQRRLREEGFSDADLARLTCPIGIAGLKSKAPAVIAVSLAAELLQRIEAAEGQEPDREA